jgi:adenosylcobinamide-GDP ribazoletransferase
MLHLDGFIDCCDALLGTRSIERRLDILRDSRVGAYGVIGGGLLLLLLYAALVALSQPEARVFALIAAPLLGRLGMVYAVVRYPYARPAGVGSPFRARGRHLAWALALGGALLVMLAIITEPSSLSLALLRGALTAGVALAVALIVPMWMSRRLGGGLTGDAYGALNECIEVAVLVLTPLSFAVASQLAQVLIR